MFDGITNPTGAASGRVLQSRRSRTPWAVVALVPLLAVACTSTPTSPTTALITITAAPNPVVAVASPVAGFTWRATFTATVTESAGTAVTVNNIGADVKEASNGIPVTTGGTVVKIVNTDATNQGKQTSQSIPAKGTFTIIFVIDYTLPNGGREAVVDIAVSGLDTNSVTVTTPSYRVSVK